MKLVFKYCLLALALMLASCEQEEILEYVTLSPEKIVLKVGEEAHVELTATSYKVHHIRTIAVYPKNDIAVEDFLCEINDVKNQSFNLKALHPGVDTLVVQYHYGLGTFAYSGRCRLPIRVEEY